MAIVGAPSGPSPIVPPEQPAVEAQALIKVRQAVMLLADATSVLKTNLDSDVGKAVLAALKTLAPVAPGVEDSVARSEMQSLVANNKPVNQAPQQTMLGTRMPIPQYGGVR